MSDLFTHPAALTAALAAGALAALGEWLHRKRTKRIALLAFGPGGRPRAWTRAVSPLTVACAAALAWSLVMLLGRPPDATSSGNAPAPAKRHLLVMLDVSPSMFLTDAGADGTQTRAARATELVSAAIDQVTGGDVAFTAACFYTRARVLVSECRDRNLITHLARAPMTMTYQPGETDLIGSLNQLEEITAKWPRASTTLLVITDGDVPVSAQLKPLPPAIGLVLIVGVGDPVAGASIHGNISRQDGANLAGIARRLGGEYHDCNAHPLPRAAMKPLGGGSGATIAAPGGADRFALPVMLAAAVIVCTLPMLLEWRGSPLDLSPRPLHEP